MRRGLISWSRAELPEAVLESRVAAAQAAMARAGLDALVVYTTPARAAGVAWLAGFVPYWNEALLVVPRAGAPALVSALSNRVQDWIQRNAHVGEVRNAPRIGTEAAKVVARGTAGGVIGVVDLAHLPAAVIEQIRGEGFRVEDASGVLAQLRAVADPADLALHFRAAHIAHRALSAIPAGETDAGAAIARADGKARRLGAEEVYPGVAADLARSRALVRVDGPARLGELAAVRLSVAYKGAWVRLTRTLSRDPGLAARIDGAAARLAAAVAGLPRTDDLAACTSWVIEATRTTMPLEPLAGAMIDDPVPLSAGSLVNVQAGFMIEGTPVLTGGPVLIGQAGAPACLLVPPVFAA